jgi:hypothetical protein
LDLPQPLGPTTQVIPGSNRRVVEDAKDLNPLSVRLFKYKRALPPSGCSALRRGDSLAGYVGKTADGTTGRWGNCGPSYGKRLSQDWLRRHGTDVLAAVQCRSGSLGGVEVIGVHRCRQVVVLGLQAEQLGFEVLNTLLETP